MSLSSFPSCFFSDYVYSVQQESMPRFETKAFNKNRNELQMIAFFHIFLFSIEMDASPYLFGKFVGAR